MAEFTVEIQRTVVHTCSISVTAKDEEKATEKAEQMCEDAANGIGPLITNKIEWGEDSTLFEINSVDED